MLLERLVYYNSPPFRTVESDTNKIWIATGAVLEGLQSRVDAFRGVSMFTLSK